MRCNDLDVLRTYDLTGVSHVSESKFISFEVSMPHTRCYVSFSVFFPPQFSKSLSLYDGDVRFDWFKGPCPPFSSLDADSEVKPTIITKISGTREDIANRSLSEMTFRFNHLKCTNCEGLYTARR